MYDKLTTNIHLCFFSEVQTMFLPLEGIGAECILSRMYFMNTANISSSALLKFDNSNVYANVVSCQVNASYMI